MRVGRANYGVAGRQTIREAGSIQSISNLSVPGIRDTPPSSRQAKMSYM
jgi:riboflavin synthase